MNLKIVNNTSQRKIILYLLILVTVSISVKLYFLPFETPFKTDAIDYFSFAFEISKTQQFPTGILKTNDGWSLFLSPIFSIIGHSDMMNLINAQRITGIIISSLTIIPVYLLCKRFVSSNYSIIGASLFAFSHRLMENSILGLTESLFIFLATFFLYFSLSKNSKIIVFSFIFLALSSIVRYESLLFLIPLSIIFFIKFRKEKFFYLRFSLFILLFILILLPIATIRMDSNNMDGLTSHAFGGITNPAKYSSISENKIETSIKSENNFITNSFLNTLKFLGFVLIPLFIFFFPTGIYNLIKKKNSNLLYLLILGIFMILPAMYAYGREIQDTRYLYVLFPIFCVISVYGLDVIKKFQKPVYIILILVIIILSSVLLLFYEQPNYAYDNEILFITKDLVKTATGVNDYPGNSYVKIATLEKNWPNSLPLDQDWKTSFFINKLSSKNYNSLEEYILAHKTSGLTHLVLTESNRSPFLDELLVDHEKYSYLQKIFDSKNSNFQNKIIVLKIDYEIFEEEI